LWPHRPVCAFCGVLGDKITKMARPRLKKRCKDSRKPSRCAWAPSSSSRIFSSKRTLAGQPMESSKKVFSAHELHRILGTNYETARFLFHRLRPALEGSSLNRSDWRRTLRLMGSKTQRLCGKVGKMPVVSLVERDNKTVSMSLRLVPQRRSRSWQSTPPRNPA
jgi:hypothetical protein